MRDVGLANAGVLYARPGPCALGLLEETAWRIQLLQLHPEIVARIVPFARQPFYANSDDQTLLNDAILSAVIGNRTFLGSTARYEARSPAAGDLYASPGASGNSSPMIPGVTMDMSTVITMRRSQSSAAQARRANDPPAQSRAQCMEPAIETHPRASLARGHAGMHIGMHIGMHMGMHALILPP